MVVDHADGLHVGVADGGAEEFEPPFFHVFTDRIGDGRTGKNFRGVVDDGLPVRHKAIEIVAEGAEFFLYGEEELGGADGGADLQPVADDAFVVEEPVIVGLVECGHFICVEVGKSFFIVVAATKDSDPAQPRLRRFEDQEFEEFFFIVGFFSPFFVVVLDVKFVVAGPVASGDRLRHDVGFEGPNLRETGQQGAPGWAGVRLGMRRLGGRAG